MTRRPDPACCHRRSLCSRTSAVRRVSTAWRCCTRRARTDFFFRDGQLVVAHLPDPDLPPAAVAELVGDDPPRLRSRAGKHAWALVRAEEGVAVTEDDGRIRFVEVFPPTTFDDYRDRIHAPPPHFVE